MPNFKWGNVYVFLASATVDAEAAKIGDVVYNVTTYDPEGDAITFSSVCDPAASCPLELRQSKLF